MRHRFGLVLALIVVASAMAPADADPTRARADAAYREGRRLYDLRDWDEAIAKFKEAYELSADAPPLYNIAQAYRLKGDCVVATSYYHTYLRNFPKAKNRALVEQFLSELEPCVARASEPPPEAPPSQAERQPPAPQPLAVHARRSHAALYAGGAALAIGAIAGGFAIHEAIDARDVSRDVTSGMGAWQPNLQSDGKRDDRDAVIFAAVGGAALVAGGVAIWLGVRDRGERPAPLAVSPTRGGASLVWSCAF